MSDDMEDEISVTDLQKLALNGNRGSAGGHCIPATWNVMASSPLYP